MRRVISAILSLILVSAAAYGASVYIASVEEPVAAKYTIEAKVTLWTCPSAEALGDGQIPEIFDAKDYDAGNVDESFEWISVNFEFDQAFDAKEVSGDDLACHYLRTTATTGSNEDTSFVRIILRDEFVGQINFDHMDRNWSEYWGKLVVHDGGTQEAYCDKSRQDCAFLIKKKSPKMLTK